MAYKAQIIDLNSPNNIGSWAKIGPILTPLQ